MILTTRNLLQYLLAKDLVSKESVVHRDITLIDISGRNRNFKVIRTHNTSYFVKQIQNWDTQTIAMLQCEALCYWLSRNDPDFASLAPLMPEFYSYDLERQILVTGLVTNGEDLLEYFRGLGGISVDVASELGTVLGTYHREAGDRLKNSPNSSIFPRQVPWILSPERRNSHPFKELSKATSQLIDSVESCAPLCAALTHLRDDWRTSTLMHGDMRLQNFIVCPGESPAKFILKIVDWELADIGDPCWDIGNIIQAFLSARIISLPVFETPLSLETLLTNYSLNGWADAIISFWESYATALQVEPKELKELFERCIAYGAAGMILSAYEYTQLSPQLSKNALHLLEVSSDILKCPADAAKRLLNVETS